MSEELNLYKSINNIINSQIEDKKLLLEVITRVNENYRLLCHILAKMELQEEIKTNAIAGEQTRGVK